MGAGRKKEKTGSEGIMKKKVRGKKERSEFQRRCRCQNDDAQGKVLFLRPRSHGSSLCRTRVLTVLRKISNTVAFVFAITSRRRLSASMLGFFFIFPLSIQTYRLTLYRQICAKNKFFFFRLNSFKLNLKIFRMFLSLYS